MRKKRVWFPGAIYHVMQRGIRKTDIFYDDEDYKIFLKLIQAGMEKWQCQLHAYCLMTNHYHALIETSEEEIGKFVKYVSQNYAMYFNRKYGYKGHVFEGRFVSGLVKQDSYFLQTSRYIHLNPVKAYMAKTPEQYPWSSYRILAGMEDEEFVTVDRTWAYFGTGEEAVTGYRDFVEHSGEQYILYEEEIRNLMEEDALWQP